MGRRLKFATGATASHAEGSLCLSCRNGQSIRGQGINEEIVHCTHLGERVRFRVTECSSYDDRSKPTLRAMSQIAWQVSSDKKTKQIGFLTPQEFRAAQKEENGGVPSDGTLVLPDGTVEWM